MTAVSESDQVLQTKVMAARERLDEHVRKIIQWHFNPDTGCPFWLSWAEEAGWDPKREIEGFDDLLKFDHFKDDLLSLIHI